MRGTQVRPPQFGPHAGPVRSWLQDGQPWSKGSGLTASLWIVALAAHLGYDALVAHGHAEPGLGAATVVLYLASSLGIQRVIVQSRTHRLQAGRAAPVAQLRGFS